MRDVIHSRGTPDIPLAGAGTPVVSVIIPAYNASKFIAQALDSVFAQTFRGFEVIVIDDGSPDTEELERVLQRYQDRIVYLKQENRGPSAARNLGIRHAQGEFLGLLDSDDIWEASYLQEQLHLFREDPSFDAVYSDVRFFGDTPSAGKTHAELYPPETFEVTFENLLAEKCPMLFPSCLVVRRAAAVNTGLFDEGLKYSEDAEFILRLAYRGAHIASHNNPLVRRRAHGGSLNARRSRVEQGELSMLEHLGKTLTLSPAQRSLLGSRIARRRAAIDLRLGKELLAEGKLEEARRSFASANAFLRRPKLSFAIAGLRFAPRLSAWTARGWRVLDTWIEALRRQPR